MTLKREARGARSRTPVAKKETRREAKKRTKAVSKRAGTGKIKDASGLRKRTGTKTPRNSAKRVTRKAEGRRKPGRTLAPESLSAPSVERVREEARVLGALGTGRAEAESQYRLPDAYGQDRIVAMTRDPYWVCVYWEITDETLMRAMQSLGKAQLNARRILRVYTVDGQKEGSERILFDVSLTLEARNWYINVGGPGRSYRIEIGLLTVGGKFVCLASSNFVSTPRDRMSDVLDEKWMSLPAEYEEMYALSGGLTRGVSSPELHERLARELEVRLASPLFSPGIREIPGKEQAKPFWFTLDADLVVYGATVPGSKLKINGGDWRLRDDGTFSFRCHLPDGDKEMEVSASSSDEAKHEHAKVKVTRATRRTGV